VLDIEETSVYYSLPCNEKNSYADCAVVIMINVMECNMLKIFQSPYSRSILQMSVKREEILGTQIYQQFEKTSSEERISKNPEIRAVASL
jgi:hypothetical protein